LDVDGVLVCKTWATPADRTVTLTTSDGSGKTATLDQAVLHTLNLRQRFVLIGTQKNMSYEWTALNLKEEVPVMLPNLQVFTPDKPWELLGGDTSLYRTTPFISASQNTIAWLELPADGLWTFVFQVKAFSNEQNVATKLQAHIVLYTSDMKNVVANGLDNTDAAELFVTSGSVQPMQAVYTGFATSPIPARNTFADSRALRPMLEFGTLAEQDVASVTFTLTEILLYAFQQG
jgi:hypothetical protein